jgi:hypothetical protein
VYGILEDSQGKLWLSTNFGISRFENHTNCDLTVAAKFLRI